MNTVNVQNMEKRKKQQEKLFELIHHKPFFLIGVTREDEDLTWLSDFEVIPLLKFFDEMTIEQTIVIQKPLIFTGIYSVTSIFRIENAPEVISFLNRNYTIIRDDSSLQVIRDMVLSSFTPLTREDYVQLIKQKSEVYNNREVKDFSKLKFNTDTGKEFGK